MDATEYYATITANGATVHYEAYSIWKLSLSQRFMKGITLNCAVDNLFNYRPRNYYPKSPVTLGTTLTLGIVIDLDRF